MRLAALALCGLLAGCPAPAEPEAAEPEPAEPVEGYPRTLESADGATVTLTRPVSRCLPASANATDIIVALAGTGILAGVPETVFEYGNVPLDRADWEGRRFKRYEGEALLALRPDLVVAQGMQNPDTARVLDRAGIPVLVLPDVRTLPDVVASVEVLGRALGREDEAAALAEQLTERARALGERRWTRSWTVVPYSNYGTGGWTAGTDTTAELYIGLAGLTNGVAEAGLPGHFQLDAERLFDLDPDVLLLHTNAEDGSSTSAEVLRADPVLRKLRAVREDHIVLLPPSLLSTSSHHIVATAERLAEEVWRLLEE